jgi:hypothetical protein
MFTFHLSSGVPSIVSERKALQIIAGKNDTIEYLKSKGLVYHPNDMNVDIILIFAFLEKDSPKMKVNPKVKVIQLLTGSSKDILTTKSNLYKRFAGYSFIPNTIVFDSDNVPTGIFRKIKILKPTHGFVGSGITIVKNIAGVQNWVETNPDFKEWSLQDYVHPETIDDGHKFHIRVNLVIVCSNKTIKVFFPLTSPIHMAKKKYTEDYTGDLEEIHNVHGAPVSYNFPSKIPDGWDETDISLSNRRIRKMVIDILQEEHKFKPDWGAQNGFELFGLDVMFERNTKKPILLEFNTKTGMASPATRLQIPSILQHGVGDVIGIDFLGNTESLFTRII